MARILSGILLIILAVCYGGISSGADRIDGPRKVQNREKKRVTKAVGPFEINKKRITVILDITEYKGRAILYHSFEIKDAAGVSLYKSDLEPTPEEKLNIEGIYKLEGKSGEGLIFYFELLPSAPGSGHFFKIFGMKNEKIKLLPEVDMLIGGLLPLQEGKSPGSLRLLDGDLINADVRKGLIDIIVPLIVDLQKNTITPLQTTGFFDLNIKPDAPNTAFGGKVKLFEDHNLQSRVTLIKSEEVKKVEFISAFANIQMQTMPPSPHLNLEIADLWVKVKVNGREGWANDMDSFIALGVPAVD